MKNKIPTLLAATLFAALATPAVQGDEYARSADQANRHDPMVAQYMQPPVQNRTVVLQNHGRSGYHVRVDRKTPSMAGDSRSERRIALAIEKPGQPRMELKSHGRAGFRYHRVYD